MRISPAAPIPEPWGLPATARTGRICRRARWSSMTAKGNCPHAGGKSARPASLPPTDNRTRAAGVRRSYRPAGRCARPRSWRAAMPCPVRTRFRPRASTPRRAKRSGPFARRRNGTIHREADRGVRETAAGLRNRSPRTGGELPRRLAPGLASPWQASSACFRQHYRLPPRSHSLLGCAAQTDRPQTSQSGGAVRPLHRPEGLDRLLILARQMVGVRELQLRVFQPPEGLCVANPLLHQRQPFFHSAVQDVIEALVEKRLAVLAGNRLCVVTRERLFVLGEVPRRHFLQ